MPAIVVPHLVAHYDPDMGLPRSTARQRIFMDSLVSRVLPKVTMTEDHLQDYAVFQEEIQAICHSVARNSSSKSNEHYADLSRIGSFSTGTALNTSELDLCLFVKDSEGRDVTTDCEIPKLLEKELNGQGFCARMQAFTPHPIIKVWKSDVVQQFAAFRHSQERLKSRLITTEQRPSPPTQQAEDCLRCQIHVAAPNLAAQAGLVQEYINRDIRIKHMIMFVKHWAQARDISNPTRGTLGSFGYIMMVLHYVLNIAQPPLLPHIQQSVEPRKLWEISETGTRIQWLWDARKKQYYLSHDDPRAGNDETVGSLTRGFFAHFGWEGQECPFNGFDWRGEVLSIRLGKTQVKSDKGWTSSKLEPLQLYHNGHIKEARVKRYNLLAIEGMFAPDHNLGGCVNPPGFEVVREEFRRARVIIRHLGLIKTQPYEVLKVIKRPDTAPKASQAPRKEKKTRDSHKRALAKVIQAKTPKGEYQAPSITGDGSRPVSKGESQRDRQRLQGAKQVDSVRAKVGEWLESCTP